MYTFVDKTTIIRIPEKGSARVYTDTRYISRSVPHRSGQGLVVSPRS